MLNLFIAGTDTNVGKTYISTGMLSAFNEAGFSTIACKPVASGCMVHNDKLYNADALALQAACSVKLHYDYINPFAFAAPIAPHIAAQHAGRELSVELLQQKCRTVLSYPADICLIEGAGGWYTPLNHHETLADFVVRMQFYVVLVVGMRLGCLNHSILTSQALQQAGIKVAGWIANCIEPELPALEENLASLKARLPFPCLGVVQHNARIADSIDIKKLTFLHDRCVAG